MRCGGLLFALVEVGREIAVVTVVIDGGSGGGSGGGGNGGK